MMLDELNAVGVRRVVHHQDDAGDDWAPSRNDVTAERPPVVEIARHRMRYRNPIPQPQRRPVFQPAHHGVVGLYDGSRKARRCPFFRLRPRLGPSASSECPLIAETKLCHVLFADPDLGSERTYESSGCNADPTDGPKYHYEAARTEPAILGALSASEIQQVSADTDQHEPSSCRRRVFHQPTDRAGSEG